jgi:hypothetical protein
MADEQQLAVLHQGCDAWKAWRDGNRSIQPDLSAADARMTVLTGANLREADLREADLTWARLNEADLSQANLSKAKLIEADLRLSHLYRSVCHGADFIGANLSGANLYRADFIGANLSEANLEGALLVDTNFTGADLTGCRVYGISAWDVKLDGAKQENLIITPPGEPEITVDNLEVAQFIYLLLNNERIRHVIDTITSKVVLILGRFTPDRKVVLDALKEELRQRDYTPVLFDFDKSASKSTLETVATLAHMARFVVADLTDAKSVLQELQAIVPTNPSVPVQPLILATQEEPGMFDFFHRFPWVLKSYRYASPELLIADLSDGVILPAEAKVRERGVSPPTG